MHKLLPSILLFLILTMPFSVFSHEGEEHAHDEPAAESPAQLENGNGWRVIRSLEIGTSGNSFIWYLLIIVCIQIRLFIALLSIEFVLPMPNFAESDSGVKSVLYRKKFL